MNEKPFLLDFDSDEYAVLEPTFEQLQYKFHPRLLYAFVPEDEIKAFLKKNSFRIIGNFKTISFRPNIYEIENKGKKFTLCQAPLGAPAVVKLLEWLVIVNIFAVA